MKSRNKSNRSVIINMSSITSNAPIPHYSLYSASKVFNFFLSESLASELSDSKIDVFCIKPGYVKIIFKKFFYVFYK